MYAAGDVLLWHNFPLPRDPSSPDKDRWLIFLGKSSVLSVPIFVYLCTTTGKVQKYEPGGERATHAFIKIKAGEHGFPEPCIIDIPFNFYDEIEQAMLNNYVADIEVKGRAADDLLRRIFKLLKGNIPEKERLDIRTSLNACGITGLKG